MKKVLLTGGTGLIGKETLRPFLERGFEVYGITMDENNPNALMQLIDVYMNIDADHRKHLLPFIKKNLFGKSFWKKLNVFSFPSRKGKNIIKFVFYFLSLKGENI